MEPLLWKLYDIPSGPSEWQELKRSLLQALWGSPQWVSQDRGLNCPDAFINHYFNQHFSIQVHNLNLKTHKDLVDLILFIRCNTTITRTELIDKLNEDCGIWLSPANDSAACALDTAIRVWLMITIENWASTDSLEDYIHKSFPKEDEIVNGLPLPLDFNAYNLERIGGFNIVWTDCMHDHLSISVAQTYKELKIFHFASFIQMYQHTSER